VDYKIVWTDPAIENLQGIFNHIAEDNPAAAERMVMQIIEHAEQLEGFPSSGKVFNRYGNGRVRELAIRGYRIFYVIYEDKRQVDLLYVWHGSRADPKL